MSKNIRLTEMTKSGGWAAKIGPGVLSDILSQLPKFQDERLIVGFDSSDDASVYKIREDLAIIQTVDFFPPMVDDPFIFGQVAATNSLSDIYAMGATPQTAMNLICIPNCLSVEVVKEILAGGYDKVKEANCIIAGGHTIEDNEPKYGLCVTGFAHPKDVLTNSGCQEGDLIIATKALGSGILTTAAKVDLIGEASYKKLVETMTTLNAKAQECLARVGSATACTDVTGFGFLGHLYEMASGSKKTIEVFSDNIKCLPQALEMAQDGIIPQGAYKNRDYIANEVFVEDSVKRELTDVMFDPQTAGGLLISIKEDKAKELLSMLETVTDDASIVGMVKKKQDKYIEVK